MHPGLQKVIFTQSTWACLQTDETGAPTHDYDSTGFPVTGRDRAVQLVGNAGAVILSGDQHLAAVIRHAINDFTDGARAVRLPGRVIIVRAEFLTAETARRQGTGTAA